MAALKASTQVHEEMVARVSRCPISCCDGTQPIAPACPATSPRPAPP
jgi:hypothetical protein